MTHFCTQKVGLCQVFTYLGTAQKSFLVFFLLAIFFLALIIRTHRNFLRAALHYLNAWNRLTKSQKEGLNRLKVLFTN